MNANFARLDSKTIAKICRTLIALTLLAYLVDGLLISSKSLSSYNFEKYTFLTDFNTFIITFVDCFLAFSLFYECFYNLKEKIKTKILRYICVGISIFFGALCVAMIVISFSIVGKKGGYGFSFFPAIAIFFMFIFMFIDKILCKARGQ